MDTNKHEWKLKPFCMQFKTDEPKSQAGGPRTKKTNRGSDLLYLFCPLPFAVDDLWRLVEAPPRYGANATRIVIGV